MQTFTVYAWQDLLTRPLFIGLLLTAVAIMAYSVLRPNRGLAYH